MKYWTINYPNNDGSDITETLSEDEILTRYWDY